MPEEVAAQPFDKRLRVRKEKLLNRPHKRRFNTKDRDKDSPVRCEDFGLGEFVGQNATPCGLDSRSPPRRRLSAGPEQATGS